MRGWPGGGVKRLWARIAVLVLVGISVPGGAEEAGPARLAADLAAIGDHEGAAIEYRRLALGGEPAGERAVWLWAAAREHWRAGQPLVASRALDRAEALGVDPLPLRLLRAETAHHAGDVGAAEFYWRSLADDSTSPAEARAVAARRAAALCVRDGRFDDAARALAASPLDESVHLRRIETAAAKPRRNPMIGGLLGLVPGLGYIYSGEYANGARSLILNGVFLGLMSWAIDREQWAAAGAIGFLEITWYTGSIYGGIDAAHRWNRRRLGETAGELEREAQWDVDERVLPVLRLRFEL